MNNDVCNIFGLPPPWNHMCNLVAVMVYSGFMYWVGMSKGKVTELHNQIDKQEDRIEGMVDKSEAESGGNK